MVLNVFLAVLFLGATTFAQTDVPDLPTSIAELYQFQETLLKNNPKFTKTDVHLALAKKIASVGAPENIVVFATLIDGLEMISLETLNGELVLREKTQTDKFERTNLKANYRTFVAAIENKALYGVADPANIHTSLLEAVFSQLHLLTEAQFYLFASNFLSTLKVTDNFLFSINELREESFVEQQVEQTLNRLVDDGLLTAAEASAYKKDSNALPKNGSVLLKLERSRANARMKFQQEHLANATYGSELLRWSFEFPFLSVNLEVANFESELTIQRQRVVHLMERALESGIYSKSQVEKIRKTAKAYLQIDIAQIALPKIRRAYELASRDSKTTSTLAKIAQLNTSPKACFSLN